MLTSDLDYPLPPAAVAQHPVSPRDAALLLVDTGAGTAPVHRAVRDLPDLLREGDLLVVNDTRVLRARVPVVRPGGGGGEVLLLEPHAGDGWWVALVRPSRRLRPGTVVLAARGDLQIELGEPVDGGRRLVRPVPPPPEVLSGSSAWLEDALEVSGEVPLPPYITAPLDDAERYQTVFARRAASSAAPTAGLHLTDDVVRRCAAAGVGLARVELVVGLDTFRPIEVDAVEDHPIHSEWYRVPAETWAAVQDTRAAGGRVVAVGTTVVRSLESQAATGQPEGRTRLFITPGFTFEAVDLLMTNFHLPRSSLLALVQAFVGERWRDLYEDALRSGYRLLSFGDASLLQHTP
ncbi:MAG: tRNA preQ1(34) S-adenosylmethionine ribosyltransferase-isomerase QueA, partial [Actinomycetes bacterium]